MRRFLYFLYENFDADALPPGADNPRSLLNSRIDMVLSAVADRPPYSCLYDELCSEYSEGTVSELISAGIFRRVNEKILFDTPIFLGEDVPLLQSFFKEKAVFLASLLAPHKQKFFAFAETIRNGFSSTRNLYHILCSKIFDGSFFDILSERHVLASSRQRDSGLDYLVILYENCPELNLFSNRLLCSCNRFTDGNRSLESFGDADGNRLDFYRFFRMRETTFPLPQEFQALQNVWSRLYGERFGEFKKDFLLEVQKLAETGSCDLRCMNLLEAFGYANSGKLCVPVFRGKDRLAIQKIEELAESLLAEPVSQILRSFGKIPGLCCCRHGVSPKETANEAYHILFGMLNEEMALQGFVDTPSKKPGEGRYLRAIEIP